MYRLKSDDWRNKYMRITELLKPESIDLNAAPKDKNDTIK